mgnify:FL=1
MLGLPVRQLFFNMIPVLVLCMVLIAAFVLVPALTMKIMIFLGNAIRIFSFLLFGVAVFGIFMPKYAVVEDALIEEMPFYGTPYGHRSVRRSGAVAGGVKTSPKADPAYRGGSGYQ